MKFLFGLLFCLLPLSLNAQGVLETMQADIAANKSKADSLAAELLIQKAKVATLETEMAAEKASTAALQAALNVEKAKIVTLEASVLLHKNRLDAAEAALTLLTARIAALEGAQPPPPPPPPPDPPPPPPPPPSGRRILAQSDFTLLGSFDIQGNIANGIPFGDGLTHRYVNGQLHLMTIAYNSGNLQLVEFPVPAFGGTVTSLSKVWNNINAPHHNGPGYWRNLWFDKEANKLWSTSGGDYPDDVQILDPKTIVTRTLNDNGTVSNVKGMFGIAGIGGRATYGGVRKVPSWFKTANNTGKYIAGWGGYTSRMGQGLKCSMGLFACTFDLPDTLAGGADVPNVHILADHRSGTTSSDWYGQTQSLDRGVRNSDVINYYDGGDSRSNPQTPPSIAPIAGAKWLSPAPDGLGRWVWGDSFYGCGEWIDNDAGTRQAHGLITVGTFNSGKAYYMTSTLNNDRRTAEIQVTDPAHLAQVKAGTRQPWNVKPTNRWEITAMLKQGCDALRASGGNVHYGGCAATTFDETTNRLYIVSHWAFNTAPFNSRVWVFQVGGQ